MVNDVTHINNGCLGLCTCLLHSYLYVMVDGSEERQSTVGSDLTGIPSF